MPAAGQSRPKWAASAAAAARPRRPPAPRRRAAPVPRLRWPARSAASEIVNVAPWPGRRVWHSIVPPCTSMIDLGRRPAPGPSPRLPLVVKNGSQIRSATSAVMPQPLSATVITARRPRLASDSVDPPVVAGRESRGPAFLSRLISTCCSLTRLALTQGSAAISTVSRSSGRLRRSAGTRPARARASDSAKRLRDDVLALEAHEGLDLVDDLHEPLVRGAGEAGHLHQVFVVAVFLLDQLQQRQHAQLVAHLVGQLRGRAAQHGAAVGGHQPVLQHHVRQRHVVGFDGADQRRKDDVLLPGLLDEVEDLPLVDRVEHGLRVGIAGEHDRAWCAGTCGA